MKYIYLFYRKELVHILCISALFAWATIASYLALQNKTRVLIISSENGEMKTVSGHDLDSQRNIEENFVRRFLLLSYNFDTHSYQINTERSSDLMSENLFRSLKQQLKINLEDLRKKPFSQSAEVFKCDRPGVREYECELMVWNIKDGVDHQRKVRVALKIRTAERTLENPWGYEVDSFEVKKI